LNLQAPPGYANAYITSDSDGNIYVIMVKKGDGGKAQTLVIEIKDAKGMGLNYNNINIQSKGVSTTNADGTEITEAGTPITAMAVSMNYKDYTVTGGEGDDVVFLTKGYRDEDDDANEITEEDPNPYVPPSNGGGE